MTVKQLISELNKYPETMQVFVSERTTEFAYGVVDKCFQKEIRFTENEDDSDEEAIEKGVYALDTVVVITD